MNDNGIFRRRHLPHWDVEGKPFFVTACLDGSISAAGLKRIRQYRMELDERPKPDQMSVDQWEHHKHKLLFAMVDDLLDQHGPVRHLEDERQAEIVQNAFLHFAGERYKLLAFVVMPSHHHWLFLPDEQWSLEAVQRSIQTDGRRTTHASGDHLTQHPELYRDDVQSNSRRVGVILADGNVRPLGSRRSRNAAHHQLHRKQRESWFGRSTGAVAVVISEVPFPCWYQTR